jgi:hypothetical protein
LRGQAAAEGEGEGGDESSALRRMKGLHGHEGMETGSC